ncbi:WAT1-related protein At4g30420-like isoform X2 [Ziziphus jujuba]|uniref:WAT1-related protein n=1 Tax=Ziziphus jujuba TaxID=326968 RepID=A0A6P4AFD7_ZIZJJ|nr:WAT1-related protein At4g30420-like isoform X2 [Ziziphus jujuba]
MGGIGDYKPAMAMSGLQFAYAGVALSTRAALLEGMNARVFVVYRQAIATLVIAPVAYFSRLEEVDIRKLRSIAKIHGTVLCVCGAVSMALLRGPKLLNTEHLPGKSLFGSLSEGENLLLGCAFLFASACCRSIWLILQVPISTSYPDHLSLSAWMCFLGTIQSATVTLFLEQDPEAWIMHSSFQLAYCFFVGIVGSGISFFVQAWCISRRGPLFAAMFNPLSTVMVTILAAIFLHEKIYAGGLVGAIGVIIGLYILLWGKAEGAVETKKETDHPKLQNEVDEEDILKKTSHKIDLEEPFLSHQASFV